MNLGVKLRDVGRRDSAGETLCKAGGCWAVRQCR